MEQLIEIITYCIRAVQGVGGSYAAFKLSIYGIAYMKKNMQKVEEAKDGMKNVGIGLAVVLGCEAGITFLKSGLVF